MIKFSSFQVFVFLLTFTLLFTKNQVTGQVNTDLNQVIVNIFEVSEVEARLQLINAIKQDNTLGCFPGDQPGQLVVFSQQNQFSTKDVQRKLDKLKKHLYADFKQMSKEERGELYLRFKETIDLEMIEVATADRTNRGDFCTESDPFCTNETYTFPAGVGGDAEEGPFYDCLLTQPNPAWYHMKIQVAGSITITMSSEPEKDIDYICWGPFDDPVSPCPNGLTSSKVIDCSYSISSTEICEIPNALLNKYYVLLITNYSDQPCNITFQKTAGTGETDCSIVPPPVGSNSPVCVGETLELYADNVPNATYQWTGPNNFSSTQQNPLISNVSMAYAGNYSLVITVGGSSSDPVSIEIEVNPMPTPDFTFNEVCLGEPTVFTDASTVNPPSGVITQWEWAFGDGTYASGQNQEHTYAAAGSFQVTLTTYTSVGQCAQSITKQILVKMSAEANAGPDVSIHNGWHTDLSGSASGGSGNYAFYWQPEALVENPNNAETPTVSLNATTTFTLTVTDNSGGCSTDDDIVVTVTGFPFTVNASADDNTLCQDESTTLHASVSGGSGTYTYSWTSSPTGFTSDDPNPVVSPTVTTTYTVSVFDGQNTLTDEVMVELGVITLANAGPDKTIATGWTTLLEGSATGGSGDYSINWQPEALLQDHTIIQPTTIAMNNSTQFTLLITDNSSGCQSSDNMMVTVSGGVLGVTATASPSVICQGSNSQLSTIVSGGSGSYTYLWTTIPPSSWSSTQPAPLVTPSQTTTYQVEVNDGQNSVFDEITVEVGLLTIADAGPNITIPSGTNTQLQGEISGGSGSYTVHWQPEAMLVNATILQPTTVIMENTQIFHLTITDNSSGCSSTDQMTVIISGIVLSANPTSDPESVCPGESAQLFANAAGGSEPYTYNWTSDPAGFTSNEANPMVTPEVSTTYFLLVDDGSSQVTGQAEVLLKEYSTANAGEDQTTNYDWWVSLEGSVIGNQQYTVMWYPAALVEDPSQLTTQTIPMQQTTQFTLTVTNSISTCVSSDNVNITVMGGPLGVEASASATVICSGEAIVLDANPNGGSGNYTYEWSSPNGFHSTLKSPTVEPSVSTSYQVEVSDGMNTSSDQITITVNPSPVANAGSNQIINVGTWTTLEGSASGGTGNFVYHWIPIDSLDNPAIDPLKPQPKTKVLMNDTRFTLTINDLNGCESEPSSMWVLTEGDQLGLFAEATKDSLCYGEQTTLLSTPYGGSGDYNYNWVTNNSSWQSTEQSPTVNPTETTTYTLTVNDGYLQVFKTVPIVVNSLPEVDITPSGYNPIDNTIFVCVRDSVWLDAGTGLKYLWMNGATEQKQKAVTNGSWIDIQDWSVRVTNPQTGCISRDSLIVFFDFNTCNIGINETNLAGKIKIYPNPTKGTLWIDFNELNTQAELALFSLRGLKILELTHLKINDSRKTVELDVSELTDGIYVLRIKGDKFVFFRKIIKQ